MTERPEQWKWVQEQRHTLGRPDYRARFEELDSIRGKSRKDVSND